MEKKAVWQMVKEAMESIGDSASYAQIKKYIHTHYNDVNDNTITCQIIACTVNHNTRIHYLDKTPRLCDGKQDFLYTTGRGQIELYRPEKHGIWEIRRNSIGTLEVSKVEETTVLYEEQEKLKNDNVGLDDRNEQGYVFPLEAHLRDFLVQNIETIDVDNKKLSLYIDEDGVDGVEYRTGVGNIDILAVDEDGDFVVLELKLSRGNDATLGQILRYMGWIDRNVAQGKKVKGIIVAQSIDEKLRYAVSQVKNVKLFEYKIQFSVQKVGLEG